jgi:hypothetical protein
LWSLAVVRRVLEALIGPVGLVALGAGVYVLREPLARVLVYALASDSGVSWGQLSSLDAETGHVMLVQASGALSAFLGLLWLVTLF